jgi:hypothetical protein
MPVDPYDRTKWSWYKRVTHSIFWWAVFVGLGGIIVHACTLQSPQEKYQQCLSQHPDNYTTQVCEQP